ncbi:MAG: carotenoid oxygenase family protein [Mycobacterium sp.]|nr:carotenoid oxygenase family protein [Mycobacterium sp.]
MPLNGEPDRRDGDTYATWDAAYVLGSLPGAHRREFEAHLSGCSSCRQAVDQLAGMPDLLSLLDDDQVVAIDLDNDRSDVPPMPAVVQRSSLKTSNRRLQAVPASAESDLSTGVPAETVFPVFRTGNYAPVHDELTAFDLPVEGDIPAELNGWYLRNGPNPRVAAGHWCVGDGMVHGVWLENGRAAWYRNRWLRTESFEQPLPLYNPDGTRNLHSSRANTHVIRHAGKTLALMEFSLPYEINNELETLGAYDFGGKLADSMTAHPKICPTTGELHFFGSGNIMEPHVTYHRADADGRLTISRPLDVPALTLMHDFALTADHVVFLDLPLVFDLNAALAQLAQQDELDLPFRWDDQYGARLGVLRRDDPYGPVRWFDIDPCYVFHIANAYDLTSSSANSIVLQVVRYPEMWRDNTQFGRDAVLWRWTLDLDTGTVTETQLDDRGVEFPRVDDRRVGAAARYSVAVGSGALVRYDLQRDSASEHRFAADGQRGAPDEAVFAPAPGQSEESAGWYLTYVYDPVRDGSDLVVIDASDFEGEPVARVRLPRRVPHGFHGNWLPA